jgi:parallel beta-helix repeat protein
MQFYYKKFFILLAFLSLSNAIYASVINITGNKIITTHVVYENSNIDMTNGRFTINEGGLTLKNCIVNVKISPANPFMILLNKGNLNLNKTRLNVTTDGITPDPKVKSIYHLITINNGNLSITHNHFILNNPYTVGLLTTQTNPNNNFVISKNIFKNFHGGIYLSGMTNVIINNNRFERISFSNVYFSGQLAYINDNVFLFPGNLSIGDAIVLENANHIFISNNIISNSAGYGILMVGAQDIFINENKMTDGASYGVFIRTPLLNNDNDHITLSNNYIAQNCYGLAGETLDHLIVTNNIFIQRFNDASTRRFWTDNANLLPLARHIMWSDNYYKEAFTQEVPGDDSSALQFVPFPQQGGVVLPLGKR